MSEALDKVTEVFRDVFEDDSLVITPETSAADVEGWDSVMHVSLLLNVEKAFGVKFTSTQIASMTNVGDMLTILNSHQPARH